VEHDGEDQEQRQERERRLGLQPLHGIHSPSDA
jgi:hypothetical protein